jgi:hypothetical protein
MKFYVYYSYEPDYGDLQGFKDLKEFDSIESAHAWIDNNSHYNIVGPLIEV